MLLPGALFDTPLCRRTLRLLGMLRLRPALGLPLRLLGMLRLRPALGLPLRLLGMLRLRPALGLPLRLLGMLRLICSVVAATTAGPTKLLICTKGKLVNVIAAKPVND
ncbi:MAG: hypothetical protein ACLQMO_11870, partial [Acidobacteriaceae bacterium]